QFDEKLTHIYFYFMGEPLLNKDAYPMIRYAADRGIWVSVCTNGNHVDPDQLVKSGIGEVNFQIGGMTQETHDIYRKGGKLCTALENLEQTIRIRNSYPEFSKMKINAGFILMRHNEHEVNVFIEYCTKIGVDNYSIIGTCIRNYAQGEEYLPSDTSYWSYDVSEYNKGNLVPKIKSNNYCEWVYATMTILVNGDVVPCCRDPCGTIVLGNFFRESLQEIWNNEKYQKLRKQVSTDSNNFSICKLCSGYSAPLSKS
ncbi:MAG: radical SAM/SPASM domain-containing protein, partial [Anaerolineaceae bacterium]